MRPSAPSGSARLRSAARPLAARGPRCPRPAVGRVGRHRANHLGVSKGGRSRRDVPAVSKRRSCAVRIGCATRCTPKAVQTRLIVSKRGSLPVQRALCRASCAMPASFVTCGIPLLGPCRRGLLQERGAVGQSTEAVGRSRELGQVVGEATQTAPKRTVVVAAEGVTGHVGACPVGQHPLFLLRIERPSDTPPHPLRRSGTRRHQTRD